MRRSHAIGEDRVRRRDTSPDGRERATTQSVDSRRGRFCRVPRETAMDLGHIA